jgi:hypothetical protein
MRGYLILLPSQRPESSQDYRAKYAYAWSGLDKTASIVHKQTKSTYAAAFAGGLPWNLCAAGSRHIENPSDPRVQC